MAEKITVKYVDNLQWINNLKNQNFISIPNLNLNRVATTKDYEKTDDFNIQEEHNPWGFIWDDGDQETEKWYPQGIDGNASSDLCGNNKWLVASWYGKEDENYGYKGARISFINISDPNNIKYRHVLLVEQYVEPDTKLKNKYTQYNEYKPIYHYDDKGNQIALHAGGIAWYKNFLYVVDTNEGIRVFDLSKIFEINDEDKNKCGLQGEKSYAFGYKYALPQIGIYNITGAKPYSCISLENINGNLKLWTAQYKTTGTAKMFGFDLKEDGKIDTTKEVQEYEIKNSDGKSGIKDVNHVQGVYREGNNTWISRTGFPTSYKGSKARLVTQEGSDMAIRRRWPNGAEDLYCDHKTKQLWNLTEHPKNRVVFKVDMSTYIKE